MPIGTDDGQQFQDGMEYAMRGLPAVSAKQKSDTSEMAANETSGDFQSRWGAVDAPPKRVVITGGTVEQPPSQEPITENSGQTQGRSVWDQLTGSDGGERYQLWPEKMARSSVSAMALPGDVLSGKVEPGSTQEIERAADLAGLMVFGPAPVAAKMADGTLGSFAGVTSRTIDRGAMKVAQDSLAQGVHPDEIWQKTGFFKGADNRWRYEIPDENAKLNPRGWDTQTLEDPNAGGEVNTLFSVKDKIPTSFVTSQPTRLPDVLDHPDLYDAYPVLKSTKIQNFPFPTKSLGQMDSTHNVMYLQKDLNPEFARSVILHEIQHKIQAEEGFSRGGSPREFSEDHGKSTEEAFELYKRFMGEVEARNVQSRMDFDFARRQLESPRSTEDRPRFVQIPAATNGPALLPRQVQMERKSPLGPRNQHRY